MLNLVVVLFALAASCSPVWSLSSGAPLSTCDTMEPQHGVAPRKTTMPYKITVNKHEIDSSGEVEITISGTESFKGLLLQVRDGDKAVGEFVIPDDDRYVKAIGCHGGKATAATHKNAAEKKETKLKWKAPQASGKYQLYATIVQKGEVFWVRQPSALIKVN